MGKYLPFKHLAIFLVLLIIWNVVYIIGTGFLYQPPADDVRCLGIVFGATVYDNGEPSGTLKARLNVAADLYQKEILYRGNSGSIIVSWWVGKNRFDESKVMADFLVRKGIPRGQIMLDNLGVNTRATLQNAIPQATKTPTCVVLVSDYFHLARARLVFFQTFPHWQSVYLAPSVFRPYLDFKFIAREVVGYWAYFFFWK